MEIEKLVFPDGLALGPRIGRAQNDTYCCMGAVFAQIGKRGRRVPILSAPVGAHALEEPAFKAIVVSALDEPRIILLGVWVALNFHDGQVIERRQS